MKTLRNTLMIALLTVCLTVVSAFANKDTKIIDRTVIRSEVTNLLRNSEIAETGLVDILFKVEGSHIKVIIVKGDNVQLNKEVKKLLETSIVKLNGGEGYYEVKINMNGAKPVKEKKNKEKTSSIVAEG